MYMTPTQDLVDHDMPSKYRVPDTTLCFNFPQIPFVVERNDRNEKEASVDTSK
jgi:hypothetical protein